MKDLEKRISRLERIISTNTNGKNYYKKVSSICNVRLTDEEMKTVTNYAYSNNLSLASAIREIIDEWTILKKGD